MRGPACYPSQLGLQLTLLMHQAAQGPVQELLLLLLLASVLQVCSVVVLTGHWGWPRPAASLGEPQAVNRLECAAMADLQALQARSASLQPCQNMLKGCHDI